MVDVLRCLGFRLGFAWAEAFADSWKPTGNYEGGAVGAQSSDETCPTSKPDDCVLNPYAGGSRGLRKYT